MPAPEVTLVGKFKHNAQGKSFSFSCLMDALPEGIVGLGLHIIFNNLLNLCADNHMGILTLSK